MFITDPQSNSEKQWCRTDNKSICIWTGFPWNAGYLNFSCMLCKQDALLPLTGSLSHMTCADQNQSSAEAGWNASLSTLSASCLFFLCKGVFLFFFLSNLTLCPARDTLCDMIFPSSFIVFLFFPSSNERAGPPMAAVSDTCLPMSYVVCFLFFWMGCTEMSISPLGD